MTVAVPARPPGVTVEPIGRRRAARRRSDGGALKRELGERIASGCRWGPHKAEYALRSAPPGALAIVPLKLLEVIRDLHLSGTAVDLSSIELELRAWGDLKLVGGVAGLECLDLVPTDQYVEADLRKLIKLHHDERRSYCHARLAADPDDRNALLELAELTASASAGDGGQAPESIGFAGERLLRLLERERPAPVEAGRPVPGHLWLLIAPTMTGKTSLEIWAAIARAAGVAPWPGAPARPAGRVLLLSLDEAPEQVARRMHSLATFHPAGRLERYAERLVVIGPDRETEPGALDALRLDDAGLATLGRWIASAEAAGDPFVEVYLDAYADLLPVGEAENSNEAATRIGGALERLAVHYGCAITLLHHAGKPKADAGEDPDVRFFGRGASALAAKARVVSALEVVPGLPHLRRIRTLTNLGPAPRSMLFEVCDPDGPAEELLFWRPASEPLDRRPEELLAQGEKPITTNELARRLAGDALADGKEPPGELKRQAAALRERWREAGLVIVADGGKGRSKTIALRVEEGS